MATAKTFVQPNFRLRAPAASEQTEREEVANSRIYNLLAVGPGRSRMRPPATPPLLRIVLFIALAQGGASGGQIAQASAAETKAPLGPARPGQLKRLERAAGAANEEEWTGRWSVPRSGRLRLPANGEKIHPPPFRAGAD